MEFPNGENACMRDRLFSSVASSWRRDLFLPRESTRQRHESPLLHFSSVGVQTERNTNNTTTLHCPARESHSDVHCNVHSPRTDTHFPAQMFHIKHPPPKSSTPRWRDRLSAISHRVLFGRRRLVLKNRIE